MYAVFLNKTIEVVQIAIYKNGHIEQVITLSYFFHTILFPSNCQNLKGGDTKLSYN
jgi:hypothetical protein